MARYYIHVEAFNLDAVVFDTHDISTIRGGSFMMLDAVKQLPVAFPGRLEPIATAASKGVFVYEDPGDLPTQYQGIVQDVLRQLHNVTDGHATFIVAVAEDSKDFPRVLARLEAEVRRQQWRTPTVVVPTYAPTNQECYLDGWRPGVRPYTVDPEVKGAIISDATADRRWRGRKLKHTLFGELIADEEIGQDLCTKDLGELATDSNKGILNGKIAYIHVDGNSFGRIRNAKCTTPETRQAFDALVQGRRELFLADLLSAARTEPDFQVRSRKGEKPLRIEVLLWGGDECTLIVPAWKGLEVLELFFRDMQGLAFEGVPMTHRAALIFCHHNAPILQIRGLAEELLGIARDDITSHLSAALDADSKLTGLSEEERAQASVWLSVPEYGNAARYLVLESFDMLRGSLERFLNRYYGGAGGDLLLYGSRLSELRNHLHAICSAAPKSRIVEIAHAYSESNTMRAEELVSRLPDSVAPGLREAVNAAIAALTAAGPAGWFLMADLWDYAEEWHA